MGNPVVVTAFYAVIANFVATCMVLVYGSNRNKINLILAIITSLVGVGLTMATVWLFITRNIL